MSELTTQTSPPEAPSMPQGLVITEAYDEQMGSFDLTCGNKFLSVIVPEEIETEGFITAVGNIPGNKAPGVTTALYTRARNIMQEITDYHGKPIPYSFVTTNPSMAAWGRSHGEEVFGWTVEMDDAHGFVADKKFVPAASTK